MLESSMIDPTRATSRAGFFILSKNFEILCLDKQIPLDFGKFDNDVI